MRYRLLNVFFVLLALFSFGCDNNETDSAPGEETSEVKDDTTDVGNEKPDGHAPDSDGAEASDSEHDAKEDSDALEDTTRDSDAIGETKDAGEPISITTTWTQMVGTQDLDQAKDLATGNEGKLYVVGHTAAAFPETTHNGGSKDAFIAQYDIGNQQRDWVELLGSKSNDGARSVTVGPNGNIYVAGRTKGQLDGQSGSDEGNIFLARYAANGERDWVRVLPTADENSPAHIGLDTDNSGNIYIASSTSRALSETGSFAGGEFDAFVAGYSAEGKRNWVRLIGSDENDFADDVAVGPSDNLYVAASSGKGITEAENAGGFIAHLSTEGQLKKSVALFDSGRELLRGIDTGSEGNVYITGGKEGNFESNTPPNTSPFVARYSGEELSKDWLKGDGGDNGPTAGIGRSITVLSSSPSKVCASGILKAGLSVACYHRDGSREKTLSLPGTPANIAAGPAGNKVFVSGKATEGINGEQYIGGYYDGYLLELKVE
jgi:hypothetical protein